MHVMQKLFVNKNGCHSLRRKLVTIFLTALVSFWGCTAERSPDQPVLTWYVFDEPSGAFEQAAKKCSQEASGAYNIDIALLPSDADQQREQLVRRLAARDSSIDLIGMDVIWTAEFATAGWILPWPAEKAEGISNGRLQSAVKSATYEGRLWAAPFTTNTQLLWYRTDRVDHPPETWDEMISMAEQIGEKGTIQAQGERYEGFTVFFASLLASADGSILSEGGRKVALGRAPTEKVLRIMKKFATSSASDPSLATSREDQARLAFEKGDSSFMVNYTFVWPSARRNAPQVAKNMGWARWPAVEAGQPSRVTIGGINLGVAAYTRYPDLAFQAAECIASEGNQKMTAKTGGLPPTITDLYDDPGVRRTFPFAETLLQTLQDAVQRPRTPFYNDISMAVSRSLHPMRGISPKEDVDKLREAVGRALRSEGLL